MYSFSFTLQNLFISWTDITITIIVASNGKKGFEENYLKLLIFLTRVTKIPSYIKLYSYSFRTYLMKSAMRNTFFVAEISQLFQRIYLLNCSHYSVGKVHFTNASELSVLGLHQLFTPHGYWGKFL